MWKCHSAAAVTVNSNSSATQAELQINASIYRRGVQFLSLFITLHKYNAVAGHTWARRRRRRGKKQPQGPNWPLDNLCLA